MPDEPPLLAVCVWLIGCGLYGEAVKLILRVPPANDFWPRERPRA